jgi:endonuclease YncB( thermonuclease family)
VSLRAASLLAFSFLGLAACGEPPETAGPPQEGCRVVKVIDGDTIDLFCPDVGTERARIIGYDTPETFEPGCRAEARLGSAATRRLKTLVAEARTVDTSRRGYDRYGRRLVRLRIDGRDVGAVMVSEGLAVSYTGGRRIDWCSRLS